jgi:hypothetical protein
MIYSLVESQVREAVAKEENINADGTINWDFVDANCYASGVIKFFKDDEAYYETWEDICDMIEYEMGLDAARQELADAQMSFDFM